MAVTPITPLPLPPTRQDPVNFAARADAFLAALPDFQIELNTLAAELDSIGINATQSEINAAQSATYAQDAANAASAFANYKGLWSSLTGPLNKPASVKHSGKYWNLLNNLANVQSSEPGVSADWEESDLVRVSGANFTGPITVPPGATGNQVPTINDVNSLLSGKANLTGADFTGPITVPAGATGAQVPQAQEIPNLLGITGQVAFFARSSAPSGWLKANGAEVSRTTYAALFAAIGTTFGVGDGSTTFKLPDLRGEFPRGWDDGRGVDSGRAFGSAQLDEFKSHQHHLTITKYNDGNSRTGSFSSSATGTNNQGTEDWGGSAEGGTETRPRNIALLACIKY